MLLTLPLAAPLRAVAEQVLQSLAGGQDAVSVVDGELVAHDLTPAQAAVLDPARVRGIVRAAGSPIGKSMMDLLNGLKPEQWQSLKDDELIVFSTKPAEGESPLPPGMGEQLRSANHGQRVAKLHLELGRELIDVLTSSFGPEELNQS